jgi:hypothetical protein
MIMNTKQLSFKTKVVFFLVCAVFLLGGSLVYAGDMCQIIRIDEGKGAGGTRLEIFPEKITVPVGTCTVWINRVPSRKVRVSFRENAKQCTVSTKAAAGFVDLKEGESCYYSESLPRGKTASLYWTQPGVYKYHIEGADSKTGDGYSGKISTEGVIEVK